MANTYYDSDLTAGQIELALKAIKDVIVPANNGKILCVQNGKIKAKSAGEIGQVTLESLNVTANGDYTPEAGVDGFDEVHVSVPNSYSASDEGKVVNNGALVAQTARTSQITHNGTYDTTLNDEVTVNVSGGGSAVIQPLSVTQNGTYNPPSGVDGYAPVTVNVSGGGGSGNASLLISAKTDTIKIRETPAYRDTWEKNNSYYRDLSNVTSADTDEMCQNIMNDGWGSTDYYITENIIGAYFGLTSQTPMDIDSARFYLGIYSGQNKTLIVTIEYLNFNDEWVELRDVELGPTTPYPLNYVDVSMPTGVDVYGVRWIHKKGERKSSNNNITFAGIVLKKNGSVATIDGYISVPLDYIKFDGVEYITLPFSVNPDYIIDCVFDVLQYISVQSIFGSTRDLQPPCWLTMYNNVWYTGNGSGEVTFASTFVGKHSALLNYHGRTYLDAFPYVTIVSNYTDAGAYLVVGSRPHSSGIPFSGKIYYYRIRSASTGNTICELVPYKLVRNSDNRVLDYGLYDTINDVFYRIGESFGTDS